MANRNGPAVEADQNSELSRKNLLGRAAILAGGVFAAGLPGTARATPKKRESVQWSAANGRFQSTFVTTAPASAVENLIQPTASVVPLTVKGFDDPYALSTLDIYSYSDPDNVDPPFNYLPGGREDKAIRFFNPNHSFWNPNDPQAYINATGSFYTRRFVVVSGFSVGDGTDGFRIIRPTEEGGMLQLWSDEIYGVMYVRANHTLAGEEASYPYDTGTHRLASYIDRYNKYVLSIKESGALLWGVGSTYASHDTRLRRFEPNVVAIDDNAQSPTAGGIRLATVDHLSQNGAFLTLQPDSDGGAILLTNRSPGAVGFIVRAAPGQSEHLTRWVDSNNEIVLSVAGAGHLTFAEATNIVIGTATGTKIGTGTTQKLGFFDATPVVQRPSHGQQTAGSGYGARERNMLNDVYSGLRALGLLA